MKFPNDSEFICIDHFDETLYAEALKWVDEHRRVAVISEQEKVSADPRVQIYYLESPLQMEGLIRKISWSAVQKKMTVIGEKSFEEKLTECHLAAGLILSEAADFCVKILKNARSNDCPYRRGMALKGAFSNVPAIIVGAGPSLEKNRHLLKEFQDKALIFAGGSALNKIDIEPHFAAAIDPEAVTSQFKNVPFCYQGRTSEANFSLVEGEKILFPDGFSDAINWIYDEERFDSGWTVGNFLTAVADYFGCSPIILVGMDFCKENQEETQGDWIMAARWMEHFAKGRHLINATEGGIVNIERKTLQSMLSQCSQKWDFKKRVDETIQKLPVLSAKDRWDEWDASLQNLQKGVESHEEEIVYQKLLSPLWQIWGPIFEREVQVDPNQKIELHKALFQHMVLQEHG